MPLICVAVLGIVFLSPAAARADADPASDVLYLQSLYLPYYAKPSPAVEAELNAAIQHAAAIGKPVRVALIAEPNDLGGVPQLFGRPLEYARFLDAELQFVYSGRLLVVMPQGAGYAKGGRLVANKAVVAARPGPGNDALARTATELVLALSGAEAAPATPAAPTSTAAQATTAGSTESEVITSRGGGGAGVVAIVGAAAGVVLVTAGAYAFVRRRRT